MGLMYVCPVCNETKRAFTQTVLDGQVRRVCYKCGQKLASEAKEGMADREKSDKGL